MQIIQKTADSDFLHYFSLIVFHASKNVCRQIFRSNARGIHLVVNNSSSLFLTSEMVFEHCPQIKNGV
jgi:hypothetical protein